MDEKSIGFCPTILDLMFVLLIQNGQYPIIPDMSQRYLLHTPSQIKLETFDLPPLGPQDIHLRSRLGAISSGTESAWYFGTDPQLAPHYQPTRFPYPEFPRFLGYEKVAEVVALDSEVEGLQIGQRVITNYGHADEYIWPAAKVVPIPDEISDEEAIFATLMNVASHGVRRSGLRLGDRVIVTGQGIVGLATLICARLAGAGQIIVTDRYAQRLELAHRFGADVTINASDGDVPQQIIEKFGAESVDIALECSSSYAALADAMAVMKRNGKVCVVAQLKGDYPQHPIFGVDFHLGELEMISSDGGWDMHQFAEWFFGAIRRGVIQHLPELISHRVPFLELDRGFQLIEKIPQDVVKVIVTYEHLNGL